MPMLQLQDKDCAIEPGCAYNIEVKSAKTRSNINYTVPGMYFECTACSLYTIMINDRHLTLTIICQL